MPSEDYATVEKQQTYHGIYLVHPKKDEGASDGVLRSPAAPAQSGSRSNTTSPVKKPQDHSPQARKEAISSIDWMTNEIKAGRIGSQADLADVIGDRSSTTNLIFVYVQWVMTNRGACRPPSWVETNMYGVKHNSTLGFLTSGFCICTDRTTLQACKVDLSSGRMTVISTAKEV
jgi:hypothetical protein